jgi:hypothetical protein
VLGQASKTWIKKISWQRVWSNRLFMDVRTAACCEIWPMTTRVDAATNPPRLDTATQYTTGAGWDAFTLAYQKPQVAGTFTYFLPDAKGSHDLKYGFEWIENRYQQGINGQSGPIRYRDRAGVVDEIQLNDVGSFDEFGETWEPSFTSNRMWSFFLQDRWSFSRRATLQVGVRVGYQRPYFEEGSRNPVLSDVFPAITVPEQVSFSRWNAAPRVGFVYDLSGAGKTALKVSAGRYYAIYGNNFNNANPGGVNSKTYKFLDQNGNRLYDGPQELGNLVSSTGGATTIVDPDLEQPYADEYSGSIEHQFWGESSVRFVYVRKQTRNVFGNVNVARIGNVTVPVQVANPFVPGQTITALDIPSSLVGVVQNQFTNIPDSDANYDNISFSAQKRFSRGLFVQGSYDYIWRDELRQPTAPSTSPLNTDPINVYSYGGDYPLNYSGEIVNRQSTTNWQARALARYEFPYQIASAFNFRVQNGYPYSPIAVVRLPNAGTQNVFVQDLDQNRSEAVPIFDIRVDKSFQVQGLDITGIFDVYNVFNNNAVTNAFLTSGSTYNRVIAALDPRAFQVAIRVKF